jgi:ADP-ribose pyrophosphatase
VGVAATPDDPASAADFSQIGEQEVWRGWLLSIGKVEWRAPDGEAFTRDVVHHPGAVAVVPWHGDGSVTLVRQFRPAVGTALYELPAGTCDVDGEPPEVTARRELAEEVGLEATTLRQLAAVYNSPGFTDQRTLLYLATGLRPCPTDRMGIEERWMSSHRLWPLELAELLGAGTVDQTTVLGLRLASDAATGSD